ncbi:hypothetical protein Lste_1369 [Legionella steelei]|uniref:Uncharacterized protein n=1 Tax=Legionella steelei TaxID=947033 RepID=A0A0W0ZHC8_9GAMM|nr:hypothetical protein [Legionella steelei]KTD68211.1 hypothetical protein Lste_1369 [Legionella steelei]
MGKFLDQFSKKIAATDKKYKRKLYQTYLTATEWRNVEMSEEYAAFLQKDKPFYRYPFFKQIYVFWQVFFQSYWAARKKHGHLELLFSEYMLMNLFIGINCTIEFMVKGSISLFLWPFLSSENKTEFQRHIAALFQDYAEFIHHTPFYNYSYFSQLGKLFSNFWHSNNKSFIDVISLIGVTVDFLAHGIVSAPIGIWYNQEENKAPETIDILVKTFIDKDDIDEETLKGGLRKKVAAIEGVSVVTENEQEQLFARTNSEKHRMYAYARLRVPRYEPFQATIEQLTTAGIKVREIAGQQNIQFKCLVKGDNSEQLEERTSKLEVLKGCTKLFSYQNGVDQGITFFSLDVPTKRLKETVEDIRQTEGVHIKLMHDF